jgi:hypothetical protein
MTTIERFVAVDIPSFQWPSDLRIPSKYFRLLVAGDATDVATEQLSRFAEESLKRGMVYCCAWGPGCERVHDIIDGVLVVSETEGHPLSTPIIQDDTVMTTWHDDETLEDVVEFFIWSSCPAPSYVEESNVWLAFSVANPAWTVSIREHFQRLTKSSKEPL